MIMDIIARIKRNIKKKITFHKRTTFVISLFACLVNKKQEEFIEETLNKLFSNDWLFIEARRAIRKELEYTLTKGLPFNPTSLADASNYKTKVRPDLIGTINRYFEQNPITTELNNELEDRYMNSLAVKPKEVQKELLTLIHGMKINISGSAAMLPALLYYHWWNKDHLRNIMYDFSDIDDLEAMAKRIMIISPIRLWYNSKDVIENDVKNILSFVKENL